MIGFSRWVDVCVAIFIASIYLVTYHIRPRVSETGTVPRQTSNSEATDCGFAFYAWIDVSLKISTLGVITATLVGNPIFPLYIAQNVTYLGLVVSAAGFGLFLWSMRCLGTEFSPCNRARTPQKLVSTGPYHWVRHPIYTSNLLLMAGLFLFTASAWILANFLLLGVCYQHSASREEKRLSQQFPEYQLYSRQTGRFLPKLSRDNMM